MADDQNIKVNKRGISIPWALVLATFTAASGGGIGTFAASGQIAREQETRIQKLETDVAVVKNDTGHIKSNQDEAKKQIEKIDDKLDKVLDKLSGERHQ